MWSLARKFTQGREKRGGSMTTFNPQPRAQRPKGGNGPVKRISWEGQPVR